MLMKKLAKSMFVATNVLTAKTFLARRSPKRKKIDDLTFFFMLLGSKRAKAAAHKTLVKLTPAVNFINVPLTNFSYKRRFGSLHITRENEVRTKNTCV